MSEKSMWGTVRKSLAGLDPVRVENRVELGTPDVNYIGGWIELKWHRKAPKHKGIFHLTHDMSTEQRVWAIRRHQAGGRCFLLLKCGSEYLLFYGYVAAEFLGRVGFDTLREKAIKSWKKLNAKELQEILMHD